jgi:hypothetical protein
MCFAFRVVHSTAAVGSDAVATLAAAASGSSTHPSLMSQLQILKEDAVMDDPALPAGECCSAAGLLHLRMFMLRSECDCGSRSVSWGTLFSCVLVKCTRATGRRDCLASVVVVAGPGVVDVNGQQLDLRKTNSWLLKLGTLTDPSSPIHTTHAVSRADSSSAQRISLPLLHGVTFVHHLPYIPPTLC